MASPEGLGDLKAEPTSSTAPTVEAPKPPTPMPYRCTIYRACAEDLQCDPEDASYDLNQPCHGWPELVKVMAKKPGFEAFQAFKDLNIKSLLYYQAELVQLRRELHELEWEDHRRGGSSVRLSSNIESLLLTKFLDVENREQLDKIREIRGVLKEYNAALLQYAKINQLPEAEAFNVKRFREWIEAHISGALNIMGPGKDSWGRLGDENVPLPSLWNQFGRLLRSIFLKEKPNQDQIDLDLVTPSRRTDIDPITRWIASYWIPLWHGLKRILQETATYDKLVSYFRAVALTFAWRKQHNDRLPGGILTSERVVKASFLTKFKERLQSQQEDLARQRKEGNLTSLSSYSASTSISFMNRIPVFLATIAACLFPIVGIIILSRLQTQNQVLGYIAIFTAIFAFGILVLCDSSTSRSDIFTATAAFAAVLVVFVHNQGIGSTG